MSEMLHSMHVLQHTYCQSVCDYSNFLYLPWHISCCCSTRVYSYPQPKVLGSSDGQGTFPVVDCVREQLVSQKCFVPCTQCRRVQPRNYFYTKRVPWNGVQVPPIGALNKVKVRVQVRLGGKLWGVTDLVFYVVVYALMCLAGQAPRQNCS